MIENKDIFEKPIVDKNDRLFQDGDIFNIHQIVNGCDKFILINNKVFYWYFDRIQQEYEYNISDLLELNNGYLEKSIEIIGNYFTNNWGVFSDSNDELLVSFRNEYEANLECERMEEGHGVGSVYVKFLI